MFRRHFIYSVKSKYYMAALFTELMFVDCFLEFHIPSDLDIGSFTELSVLAVDCF
jgi:hypothetical protein